MTSEQHRVEGHETWTVGDVVITRVEERITALRPDVLLDGVTDDALARCHPWIEPFFAADGKLLLSQHSFVIASGTTTIVVDTCVGTHEPRPLPGDPSYLDRITHSVGGLDAVDVVICTHLHFDHVGWNTVADPSGLVRPTFPRARYLVSEPELAALRKHDPNGVNDISIRPLIESGQLDVVATGHRVGPEVALVPAPGHSPGHVSVLIESAGRAAIITGDLAHSPIQFAAPEISSPNYDFDVAEASRTREAFIARHRDTDVLVLGSHFPPPTGGHLRSAPDGTIFVPAVEDR